MATTKKTETKTEAKETKTVAKTTTAAKPAEKKTTAKKTAAKTTKTAEKKAPAKKAAPAKKTTVKKPVATNVQVFVEFGGVQVSVDEVIKNVKLTNGKSAKDITVYIKPDESKAYFVADGEEKEMDVFFC